MSVFSKFTAVFAFSLFAFVGSLLLTPASVSAAEASESKPAAAQNTPVSYSYTAQAGDSYTKLARKAVQTYGKKNKVNLTQAQIVFAEATLTANAGSPVLNLGEKRAFLETDIKSVVESAQKLTASQAAAWNTYVKYVNFNTDLVGQAK